MRKSSFLLFFILIAATFFSGCVTKKKKGETSKFGKFYHNTTSYYNGYWNATEILRLNMINMRMSNVDDYNQILEVEDYVNQPNPKMVEAEMNKAIEKVIIVSNVHDEGDWVDDCYVLMAKAQYYKQDYETAETTLQYFQEAFNPKNPYGRNYYKSPLNKKKLKKLQAKQKKEEKKLKEKEKEAKAEAREDLKKQKEKERKERAKQKERERKQKAKERERARKNKSKGKKTVTTKEEQTKADPSIKEETTAQPSKAIIAKEEETEIKPEEPKKEKDETAYNEGLLWLAKTYIKRQNYFTAEYLLDKLKATTTLNKHVANELPASFASIYIKQKNYPAAIQSLVEAIKITKDRERKSRYLYIIGQLEERGGNYAEAYIKYKEAGKKSKVFTMNLMSNLAMLKSEYKSGQKSKEDILDDLQKMVKEEKNKDHNYIIYYTMAQIELADNHLEEAIVHFQSSLQTNTIDSKLKADVYFIIAEAFFEKEAFNQAKLYYDSTATVMNKTDQRYDRVEKRAKNLIDIAKNIELIQHLDTLLYFADLSGEAQKKAMVDYAKNRIDSKKSSKAKELSININPGLSRINTRDRSLDDLASTSQFFAYNKESKEKGKDEFLKKWGRSIQLQDNWRQGSRAKETLIVEDEKRSIAIEKEQKEKEIEDSPEYKNLIKEVPQSPVQKKEVQEKLINTMFALGKLYRSVLEKYKNSNEVLEKMHSRFGPTQHELESYYHIVLNSRDLKEVAKAEEYASKLIRKYPESTYAKILGDPEYFAKAKQEAGKIDKYYEETYKNFDSGNYKIVRERIKSIKEQFGEENKYAARIALMDAMCTGHIDGKEAYIKSLNDVIIAFPNTQEQTKAREILRFLTGDVQAFSTLNDEEASRLYSFDETKPHFVAIVTYGLTEMQFVDVKISISEFNKKYYKNEKLQMSDAMLNKTDNSQIVIVKKFNTGLEAMNYFRKVSQLKSEFIKGEVNYEVLPVSQQNYLKMLGQYSSLAYRYFFEKNYTDLK